MELASAGSAQPPTHPGDPVTLAHALVTAICAAIGLNLAFLGLRVWAVIRRERRR